MVAYQAVASSDDWDEWLRTRSRSVTATDVPRLAAGGPKTWAAVRAEKEGHRTFLGNEYTEWGKSREPLIAEWAERELGMIHNTTFYVREGTRHGATPDLITADDSSVGDIKTAKLPEDGEWDTIPANYDDQLQWQMYVMGAQGAVLVVEFHKNFRPASLEPRVYRRDRDDDRIAYLIDIADQFLAEGPAPVMDGLLAQYAEAERQEERFAAEKAAIKDRMMSLIGDLPHYKHVSELGTVTLVKPEPSMRFDRKKFAESYPDLNEQFTVPGKAAKTSLRVTPSKEKE